MSSFSAEFSSLDEQFNTNYAAGLKGDPGADGEDGYSPTVAITDITGGHRIAITDKNGTKTADVMDGTNGTNGTNGASIVSTVLYGTDAEGGNIYKQTFDNGVVSYFTAPKGASGIQGIQGDQGTPGATGTTYTPHVSSEGVISWTNDGGKSNPSSVNIKGAKGDKGDNGIGIPGTNGEDGFSPTVSVSKSGRTTTITITDKSGAHTAQVLDGEKGEAGTTDFEELDNRPKYNGSVMDGDTNIPEVPDTIITKISAGTGITTSTSSGEALIALSSETQTSLEKADAAAPQSTTYTKTEVDTALSSKVNTTENSLTTTSKLVVGAINEVFASLTSHIADAVKHITSAERTAWNAKVGQGEISNRNLLDNPWFTINQRSVSTYTVGSYGVDRWKLISGTATVANNQITLNGTLRQILENPPTGTLQASVQCASGTATVSYDSSTGYFDIVSSGGVIEAVKLEVGSISTLTMDVAPNYAEELLKCQRFFYRISNAWYPIGFGHSEGTTAFIGIKLPTIMRATPAVALMTAAGTLRVLGDTSHGVVAVSSINSAELFLDMCNLNITLAADIGWLSITMSGQGNVVVIDFTADL